MDDRDFDEYYFANCFDRPYQKDDVWMAFFGGIADAIVDRMGPKRVLDAGCAMGFLVEALRERGVEAYGFDISSYAIANVPPAVKDFCWQAKVSDELDGHFDLIICQEVFPHVPLEAAVTAVGNFCRHADDVLFSSNPDYPPNPRHVNLQPPEYWDDVFARNGFYPDRSFDASFMTPWAVRFRKTQSAALPICASGIRETIMSQFKTIATQYRKLSNLLRQFFESLLFKYRKK
jgi:SAM-dependent methyltransferase